MARELSVELREAHGKRDAKRLRKLGSVPCILYGHGEKNVCLSVSTHDLDALVKRGNRMVDLTGAVDEPAFIREVQWDAWGTNVLHVDFARISAHEKVQVRIAVELRGEAPGKREGGVVEQVIHQVDLECPAGVIPDKIQVNINELQLDAGITLAELELPAGATAKGNPTAVVVQCVVPAEVPEEEEAEAEAGEPEVIGAKEEEEGEKS